ncbi:MAG TPA: hypothetical protein VJJ75_01305 [Candidatus Nanoarchaeia archaeon]|nr:hypothetical protein [Candidatus Nanoarchaeia archaeon]
MAKDYVADLSLGFDGVCCLDEFYRHTKKFMERQGYDCSEPSYREVQRGKKKTIFWDCATEKKYNDYIKNHIDVSFEVRDAEEVKAKKKNTYQCSLKVKVKGYIEKDYEERWHWNPFVFFIREVMDRFGNRNAMDRCGNEIKDESRNLINDLKAYLNVQVQ